MQVRICPKCKKEKLFSEFHKDNNRKSGLQVYCKLCQKILNKKYKRNKIRDSVVARKRHLKKYSDLTIDEFNKKLAEQNGVCAICGLPEIRKQKNKIQEISVDHNHNTGKNRGLLCSKCNPALGFFKVDDFGILNLQMAIKYLKKYG